MSFPRSFAAGLLCVGLCACAGGEQFVELVALDGTRHVPQRVASGQVHVIVFTSHECPIANGYAPTLGDLAVGWKDQGVQLYLVYVDPDLTIEQARTHGRDYALPGIPLLDPSHLLAEPLGVTRTPEAVVLSTAGMVYRGRIDDQWQELGRRTPEASVHDLRDAVAVARRGGIVPPPHPGAIGCLLPEPAR